MSGPTVVDLFAGAGGLSRGFLDAGFEVIVANEIWEPAVETYRRNHPGVRVVHGDIRDPGVLSEIEGAIGDRKVDVVVGGPPCQGYSVDGNRDQNDPRGTLYRDFLSFVDRHRPTAFVMENVRGLLSMKHFRDDLSVDESAGAADIATRIRLERDLRRFSAQRELTQEEKVEYEGVKGRGRYFRVDLEKFLCPLVDLIGHGIDDIGYSHAHEVLDAVHYGAPQFRERVFFVGCRDREVTGEFFPPVERCEHDWAVVGDALGGLEDGEDQSIAHVFVRHGEAFLERIKNTRPGQCAYSYRSAFRRLEWDKPSPTVKENHGSVFVHPTRDRCVSPRELARLQMFPDSFSFEKMSKSATLVMIGNAVNVAVSRAVAANLMAVLFA